MSVEREQQHFTIGARRFVQCELVWGQVRWLVARLKGYPLQSLTPEQIMTLLSDELPGILAIILVEDGQTQEQKIQAGLSAVQDLEQWLNANLHPEEAVPIVRHFFESAQLPKLVKELGELMPGAMATGSNKPLST